MGVAQKSRGVVQILREMGLALRLTNGGKGFMVNGLGGIETDKAAQARELCRKHKAEICAALAGEKTENETAESAIEIPEPWTPRDFYPLRRRYTHPDQIGHVLAAWNLALELDGNDFWVSEKPRLELVPDLWIFFKANGPLINQYLRGASEKSGENHA